MADERDMRIDGPTVDGSHLKAGRGQPLTPLGLRRTNAS